MANPFQNGPSGFNPDIGINTFLPRYRNSSYASVVSGSSPGMTLTSHPSLNRLSYLLNPPYEPPSDLYAAHPSAQSHSHHIVDTDMSGNSSDGGAPTLQGVISQLPSQSRAYGQLMGSGTGDNFWANAHRSNSFFTPSYLRGSNYMQKLEEAYRARQAQKETRQQSGAGLTSGVTAAAAAAAAAAGSSAAKTPASHMGMTYNLIERAPTTQEESSVAPLPTRWNVNDKQSGLEVLADGQEVKYAPSRNLREQEHETCAVRADHPMPWQAGIYYFEVSILSRRRDDATVCIGFSAKNVALSRAPGWEADSWGYHGDDGDVYAASTTGKTYEGGTFGPQDIVGCGVNFRTREAFFTKNGKEYQTAFRDLKGDLYPTVGMKKGGEHIRVNFGQTPFVFNIDKMMEKEQGLIRDAISSTSIEKLVSPPMGETELIQQLVLQFLQHDGYVETAQAFAKEIHDEKQTLQINQQTPLPGVNIKDDEDAHCIRRAILEGDIEKAVNYTYTYYPHVLDENDDVSFKLQCRTFIEMVRKSAEVNYPSSKKSNGHAFDDVLGTMDVDENGFADRMDEDGVESQADQDDLLVKTIQYGQALQAKFKDDPRREVSRTLNEVFSLLAYSNPLHVKEIAHLLDRKGRVAVAEELNSAILSSLGKSSRSALENLYGQTSVLLDYLREEGGPGSLVTIQSVIDQVPKSQPF
ncbi:SPRY domain-containing protein [Durotheca rogersii]|uniref:SPRY domain-containing protein n=1 Tax=Durotheca rogersii TaxID=419775 RepID=UPI00221E67EC|nr:SPRY domain-containing protein [Durotheca rogersii]KAI5860248.1 SPRY domain-containing protein [Durotheca rogersii]